jgi:hypothetical protein
MYYYYYITIQRVSNPDVHRAVLLLTENRGQTLAIMRRGSRALAAFPLINGGRERGILVGWHAR